VCVCSLIYPARKAHASPYIVISMACPALPYFYTLSQKRHDFGTKAVERKMRVLIFCTTFVWNIIL